MQGNQKEITNMAAYAIIFICMMLVFSGTAYIAGNLLMNELTGEMNNFIADGDMSNQSIAYWQFVIGVWTILPLLLLFAYAGWGIVRAIERRNEVVE